MTQDYYKRDTATGHGVQTHLFAVGQTVRFKHKYGTPRPAAETFEIIATLPAAGNSPQYRIRSNDERHERMTTQDNLEAIDASVQSTGEALIERTFGHG